MGYKIGSLTFLLTFLAGTLIASFPVSAEEIDDRSSQKVFYANLAGIAAITTWGVLNWDYFQNAPKRAEEGWFSEGSKEGGADKLGHFYLSYAFSHMFEWLYTRWDIRKEKSALYGALTSFGLMSWMEIGDSFSDYGFSHEDFIMNLTGCTAGYLISTHPALRKKIDFRVEYIPDFKEIDIFTDYENTKYVMAFKFNGFEAVTHPLLRHLEFQVGYYARGYSDNTNRERILYMGLGINISSLFERHELKRTARIFNYVQVPYTYIPVESDLNE